LTAFYCIVQIWLFVDSRVSSETAVILHALLILADVFVTTRFIGKRVSRDLLVQVAQVKHFIKVTEA
jgi:hypothetical protein